MRTCEECRYCLIKGHYGYDGAQHVYCLKRLHPESEGFDRARQKALMEFADSCAAFTLGAPVEVDKAAHIDPDRPDPWYAPCVADAERLTLMAEWDKTRHDMNTCPGCLLIKQSYNEPHQKLPDGFVIPAGACRISIMGLRYIRGEDLTQPWSWEMERSR